MDETQFQQLDASLDGLNGAINRLAESVAPVDSSVHQAIVDLSANLAKWQAAQTEALKTGLAMLVEALKSGDAAKFDTIIEMLRAQAGVSTNIELLKEELSIIHEMVSDLTGEKQAEIDALADDIDKSSDETEIDLNQSKGD